MISRNPSSAPSFHSQHPLRISCTSFCWKTILLYMTHFIDIVVCKRSLDMKPKMCALLPPLVLLIGLVGITFANTDAERLYDDLINGYNSLIRPVGNNSDRLTVKMALKLSQLIEVVSISCSHIDWIFPWLDPPESKKSDHGHYDVGWARMDWLQVQMGSRGIWRSVQTPRPCRTNMVGELSCHFDASFQSITCPLNLVLQPDIVLYNK